ncbi:MAG: LLM class flavin-dependent oxidoreductase [Hyphomicrobiaceae bacterium]
MTRQLHLNLFTQSRGHHEASWRHDKASDLAMTDLRYLTQMAQKAEAGLFDSVFLADALSLWADVARAPHNWLEPITALAALAGATQRIGLIATASTTYSEPFNLARQFASIDHMSGGRVGWNIVTSWSSAAAGNFGDTTQVSHAERYARAEEFLAVVKDLWNSWADDAIVDDRVSGEYAKADRIRPVDHVGQFYQVAGPLNTPRGPQGRPVLVQAGSSDTGRAFAARHAEAIFTAQMERETAAAFYADIKARVKAAGRSVDQVVVLPGLSPMIGSTEAEAKRLAEELNALADPEVGRKRLSGRFGGYDFSHLDLDTTLRVEDFPAPETVEAARSRTELIVGFVERERPTLRQLLVHMAQARGHYSFVGTPEQLAELMQDWLFGGVADGFNLMPPVLPWMLDVFIAEVVPLLQKRGIFRTSYEGAMLRDHLGLERPGDGW